MTFPITSWPKAERPREKLINQGATSLSDAELLAIFIRSGVRGKTAVDVARELLRQHGGLRNLLDLNTQQLCQLRGLGIAKCAQLKAALEISNRYLCATLNRQDAIKNSHDAQKYLVSKLRHCTQEVFACLFLDNKNRVIGYEELFYGSISNAIVYPRIIIKKALQYNAAALILAHNHTSGDPTPSLSDRETTENIKLILDAMDIRLLDHLIIGEGRVESAL